MEPKELIEAWIAAFNRGSADELADFYTEEAVNDQVALGPVSGRAAIQAFFAREFAAAKLECIPENIFEDGEWTIIEWRDHKGFRGCGFFRIQAGKIAYQRGYWDRLSYLKLHNRPMAG